MQNPRPPRYGLEQACAHGLILAFVATALWVSAGKKLWLDELFTWYQVHDKSFAGLIASAKTGLNLMPPGHFLLLWLLDAIGGLTPWTARALSILTAALGLITLHRFVRREHGATVALVVIAVLVSSSAPLLGLAAEVRPYALTFVLAVVALSTTVTLVHDDQARRRTLALNALCSFALPFVSYPAGIYSAGLLAAYVLTRYVRGTRPKAGAIVSYVAGWLLFAALAGPILRHQMASTTTSLAKAPPTWSDLVATYPTLLAFPIGIFAATIVRIAFQRRKGDRPTAEWKGLRSDASLLAALSFILVPLVLFLLARLHAVTVWETRYMLPTAAGLALIASPLLDRALIRSSGAPWFSLVVSAVALVSLLPMARTLRKENTNAPLQATVRLIPADVAGEPLVSTNVFTYFELLHYGPPGLDLRYPALDEASAGMFGTFSARIRSLTVEQAIALPRFAVLIGGRSRWTTGLDRAVSSHRLHVVKVVRLNNPYAEEIWYVERP